MKFLPECKELNNHKIVVCSEKGRKVTFENPDLLEVIKVKVDGCQISDNEVKKCDYLVIANEKENFVELKGQDIKKAVMQLESTINMLSQDKKKFPKRCFVISTSSPLRSPRIQRIEKQFKKKYNSKFKVRNNQHTVEV